MALNTIELLIRNDLQGATGIQRDLNSDKYHKYLKLALISTMPGFSPI